MSSRALLLSGSYRCRGIRVRVGFGLCFSVFASFVALSSFFSCVFHFGVLPSLPIPTLYPSPVAPRSSRHAYPVPGVLGLSLLSRSLCRQVPVAAAGLAPCLGDVALVRVVTKECGDRAATVLEKFLQEKSVASWASPELGRWGDQDGAGGGGSGGGGGGGDGGGEAGAGAGAEALRQADALLEELAVLTQHTESYDRFVRFLVEEVRAK